jgi:hypothetical protein
VEVAKEMVRIGWEHNPIPDDSEEGRFKAFVGRIRASNPWVNEAYEWFENVRASDGES